MTNRVIKFRAWVGCRNEMQSWDYFDANGDYLVSLMRGTHDPQDRVTLMQFTGLLDKNGKEIYEGDVVRVAYPEDWCYEEGDTEKHPRAGEIVVEACEVKFDPRKGFYVSMNDPWYVWEVIGNIYENPELLKP